MSVRVLCIFWFASILLLQGEAVPTGAEEDANPTALTFDSSKDGGESCGPSGQVTNIVVHGGKDGEVGEKGERGPPGPAGERGERGISGQAGDRGLSGSAGQSGVRGSPGISGQKGERGLYVGGVSYTRWGRTTCPQTPGTQLVYDGTMAGSKHNEGGSANYLCLHKHPQFLRTTAGLQNSRARLYGTEYRIYNSPPAFSSMVDHDAPCAVCYSTRSTEITIPGRITCPPLWTREYYGYLMTDGYWSHHKSRSPVCVDVSAESVPGSARETVTSMLFFIETTCTGIRCPPYSNGAEITCVVCTK